MKTTHGGIRVAILFLATLTLTTLPVAAYPGESPQVRIDATADAAGVRIQASATGPFEYTTYRPSDSLFVVDLAGVTVASPSGARVLKSDAVTSYRVIQYRSGETGIVRVEVLLRGNVEPKVERTGTDSLTIRFESGETSKSAAPVATKVSAPPVTSRTATVIEDIRVERSDDRTVVTVLGNGKLTYQALRLNNPDRLVLDFAGTRARASQKKYGEENAPVLGVRVGQFKATVSRVVIDLDRGLPYQVSAANNTLKVSFGASQIAAAPKAVQAAEAQPVAAAAIPAPAKTTQARSFTNVPAPERMVASAPVRNNTPEAEPPAVKLVNPIAADAAALNLPSTLTSNDSALASPALIKVSAPEPPAPRAEPVTLQEGKYTGEPISVNFKDLDLKDFFRLIHEISGLNVVVDGNVKGTITIVLEDVPWDQALDIALRNNSLEKQIEGNVLRIATRATLKKEADEKRDLVKAEAEAVPKEVKTYTLSYAKASVMRDTLKRFLSTHGEIIADERSNSLIIRDIPAVFPDMINLMNQLDKKTHQVEIEARVVAASRAFAKEVGTQFGAAAASIDRRHIGGGISGNANFESPAERGPGLPAPPLVVAGGNALPLNTALGAVGPTSGASYFFSSTNFALDFILSAAESRGVGKLLSKPKIFTQNNKKGTVQQGTKIPLQTVVNNTITVQYIDAVLKLEVTPQITAEGTIFLEVLVENTAIDNGVPRILGIPALTTQKVETNILVSDGGTIVVGGVIVSQQRTDVAQVPLFGSIPILGHLFKRTSTSSESRELLFFLTPRIVSE